MANQKIRIFTKSGNKIILNDSDHKASGGEGSVYVQGNTAYKIYHDPSKMLPIAKIQELAVLKDVSGIIIPKEVLFDSNTSNPVGFTMDYVDKIEFLCKLFTKKFRDDNKITANNIVDLITVMQKKLVEIHNRKIIVGDYNEMNFLVDSKFKIPYHIDVDSWQTPSFKCTAIMPSVQDQTTKLGEFNELTDWYSWAVVTFQLYIGIHPYKGRHPKYMAKDFIQRIKDKVSVFNSDTELPQICQDFSVIPSKQLNWYKEVFEKGHRSIPPMADGTFIHSGAVKVIKSSDSFESKTYYKHFEKDFIVRNLSETIYLFNDKYIFNVDTKTKFDINENILDLIDPVGIEPLYLIRDGENIIFKTFKKEEVGRIAARDYFISNNICYSHYNGNVSENIFIKGKRIIHTANNITVVNPLTFKSFGNTAIDDIFGKYRIIIPHNGACYEYKIPELMGETILDVKYCNRTIIIITNKKGIYNRFVVNISSDFSKHYLKKDEDIDLHDISFVVLPNGVTVNCYSDEKVEIFSRVTDQVKEVLKPPFTSEHQLFNSGTKLLFKKDSEIIHCTLKKI